MEITTITEPKISRQATLIDVARRAGVTVGTASGVLRDKAKERRISAEVVQRVLSAAEEMDYAPNLLVRSLHRGHTKVFSFLNGFRVRERGNYYMETLKAMLEQEGGALGYNILVLCDFAQGPEDTYKYIKGGSNDGLIFFKPQVSDPLLPYLRRSNVPVVLLYSVDDEGILSSVTDDGRAGMRKVVSRFLANGHRRMAMFLPDYVAEDALSRMRYLKEFLNDAGIELPEDRILPVSGHDPAAVNAVLRQLMSQEDPPTALFCWHDFLAYRVLEECDNLDIEVPGRLSVVGYDGVRWPARTKHILSTVRVDLEAMSKLAVDVLVTLVRNEACPPIEHLTPVSFEPGTTLGPALGTLSVGS